MCLIMKLLRDKDGIKMKFDLLKNKNFSLLMAGKAVSLLGSDMQQFALSLYVLSVTGSATIFGSMLAISILPRLLLSPIAGVFGDWFDRKKSIVTMDLINGLLIGIYAIYYFINGSLSITSIYLLVILLETTEIFFGAAMAAVIPSIVEKDDLFDANSLKSIITSIFTMLAPLLAAGLYGAFGILGVLIINSISFMVSAFSEMFIAIPNFNKRPEKINLPQFKNDFLEGVRLVRETKIIKNIIGLGMVLNFCLAPLFSVGILYIIKEIYKVSDFEVGIFSAILALSMVLTPILLSGFARRVDLGKLLIYSFFGSSLLIMIMGILSEKSFLNLFSNYKVPFILLLSLSFVIGILVTLVNISLGTLFDTLVPREIMGRTSSIMGLAITIAAPVGQVVLGIGIDAIDPMIPLIIFGFIMLIAVLYYKRVFMEKSENVLETA